MLRAALAPSLVLLSIALTPALAQERRPVDEGPPTSRILGRVVDAEGRPLANVEVRMHTVGGDWAGEVAVPVIERRGHRMEGYEVRTNADGRFEIVAPTPTSDWISLDVEPDPYHDVAGRDFGPAGGRDKPRLKSGDNDLGEFRLAPTGAIGGRVLDEQGNPIAKAEVRLDGKFPGEYGRSSRSDATGAFSIGHVPAGTYGIEALRDGYKIAKLAGIAVAVHATSPAGDIVLAIAPTISGVVVDEQGRAIANARVWGWPDRSGTGSGARTDEQGRFVVALKQADPHYFEVAAEGFAKLEERFGGPLGGTAHPVGATDVRLVMKRAVMTTFVVLDARNSQPVTRFAVALAWRLHDGEFRSGGEPTYPLADHFLGELTCEADPALFDYEITAPGYGPARGPIVYESPSSPRCIVKLAAEASLRGRVRLDGKPVADGELFLYEGSLVRYDEDVGGGGSFDEQSYYWSDWEGPQDLVFVLPRPTKHTTGADGAFSIAGLATAEYRLEIWGPGNARVSLDPLAVFEGEGLDLGDVALAAGATLEGDVIVPAGIDASTIELRCYSMGRSVGARVNADRTFRFTGVPAGRAHVVVAKAVGLVTWGKSPEAKVAAGGTQRMTLDLTDRASVNATVHVFVNGKAAEGVRVFLTSASGDGHDRLNETDASGVAASHVRALGPVDVTLQSQSGLPLGTFEKRLDLAVGTRPEATLEVTCGALEVEWPALRADEPLYLVRLSTKLGGKDVRASAMPGFDAPKNDARIVGASRARFDWMPVGEMEWTIEIETVAGNVVQRNHNFRRKFAISAGETTELALTERDRVKSD